MAYSPRPVPGLDALIGWLADELRVISAAIQAVDNIILPELHAEPIRPRTGMIVLADGTDWDPGSGAGFYGYYGAAWVKLG